MANPQPEPFVKFSKELLDALLLSRMPHCHLRVVLAIVRLTYGDHGRREAPISQSLLARLTGFSDRSIRTALSDLEREGVISRSNTSPYRSATVIALNKDYEDWGCWSVPERKPTSGPAATTGGEPDYRSDRKPTSAIEDFIDLIEKDETPPGDARDASGPEGVNIDRAIDELETAQTVVAYAADYARDHGYSLTDRQKGHLGREIGRQFRAGTDPALIRQAVAELIERNKDPSHLAYMVGDLERGGGRNGNGGPGADQGDRRSASRIGKSENGEF